MYRGTHTPQTLSFLLPSSLSSHLLIYMHIYISVHIQIYVNLKPVYTYTPPFFLCLGDPVPRGRCPLCRRPFCRLRFRRAFNIYIYVNRCIYICTLKLFIHLPSTSFLPFFRGPFTLRTPSFSLLFSLQSTLPPRASSTARRNASMCS